MSGTKPVYSPAARMVLSSPRWGPLGAWELGWWIPGVTQKYGTWELTEAPALVTLVAFFGSAEKNMGPREPKNGIPISFLRAQ